MRAAPLLLATSLLAGCSSLDMFVPASGAMHEASPNALSTPRDKALVVFLRPSYFGAIYSLRLVDERGAFVADVPGHTHVSVALPPGEHTFTGFGREVEVALSPRNILFANLGAGRVYFVYVDVDLGEGPYLEAISPGSEHWPSVREWIADTPGQEPYEETVGKSVLGGADLMKKALERAESLGPGGRAMRTLLLEQGTARVF
jgi:hypothetical protein